MISLIVATLATSLRFLAILYITLNAISSCYNFLAISNATSSSLSLLAFCKISLIDTSTMYLINSFYLLSIQAFFLIRRLPSISYSVGPSGTKL